MGRSPAPFSVSGLTEAQRRHWASEQQISTTILRNPQKNITRSRSAAHKHAFGCYADQLPRDGHLVGNNGKTAGVRSKPSWIFILFALCELGISTCNATMVHYSNTLKSIHKLLAIGRTFYIAIHTVASHFIQIPLSVNNKWNADGNSGHERCALLLRFLTV